MREAEARDGTTTWTKRIGGAVRQGLAPLRPVVRYLRRLPDRLLHPLRRRRVRRRLREAEWPESVLFLCLGNICRSPYAAAAFRNAVGDEDVKVSSAGLLEPGRTSPRAAVKVAAERGVDLSGHRSRTLTHDMLEEADLVMVTDLRQGRVLRRVFGTPESRIVQMGDLDPEPVENRAIFDPWNADESAFRETYARIDRCIHAAITHLAAAPASVDADAPAGSPAPSTRREGPLRAEARA